MTIVNIYDNSHFLNASNLIFQLILTAILLLINCDQLETKIIFRLFMFDLYLLFKAFLMEMSYNEFLLCDNNLIR